MIIKVTLTRENYSRLAAFVASKENSPEPIAEQLGVPSVRFCGSEKYNEFCSILHSTRSKKLETETKMDVTLKVAEEYIDGARHSQELSKIPPIYPQRLLESMKIFAFKAIAEA